MIVVEVHILILDYFPSWGVLMLFRFETDDTTETAFA